MYGQQKFTVRRDWYDFNRWLVTAPSGQVEVMGAFPDAIHMLDIWIEETRCQIVGQQRLNRAIASA